MQTLVCMMLVFGESRIKKAPNVRKQKHESPSFTLLKVTDELWQFCLEIKSTRQPSWPIWSSSSSRYGCQAVFDSQEVLTWELIQHYFRSFLTQLPTKQKFWGKGPGRPLGTVFFFFKATKQFVLSGK